ncbi:MAG: hypothetical protein FH751_14710 [Firmicutes bacterium]|nr:hypothetical protein [Bacillota bacterium]
MKKYRGKILLGLSLILLSLIIYIAHYYVFKDLHHILIFSFEHIAFIPIEVLLVTLIIEGFIEKREHIHIMEKLNTLIGLFFSQLGLDCLKNFVNADFGVEKISKEVIITNEWTEKDFKKITKKIQSYEYNIDINKIDLQKLKDFLNSRRSFLMRMMQNSNLLEHETFTELLKAVFHLQEELNFRIDVTEIKQKDKDHLEGDIKRVYELLAYEWIIYMKYLKEEYPYMFVTAMIHNPYDTRDEETIEESIKKANKKNKVY